MAAAKEEKRKVSLVVLVTVKSQKVKQMSKISTILCVCPINCCRSNHTQTVIKMSLLVRKVHRQEDQLRLAAERWRHCGAALE